MKTELKTEVRLAMLEQRVTDGFEESKSDRADLKVAVCEVKKALDGVRDELNDLKTNHVVFKTRIIAYWGVGVAVLSTILQFLFSYLLKHL